MDSKTIYEIIGYVSTVLVLVSFLMASVVKLRVINTIGSGIFVVYALLIGSYPTAILNLGIVTINLYFLIRLLRAEKLRTMLPIETNNAYLKEFMTFYGSDMQRFFPEVALEKDTADTAYFVYYDLVPVGVLLGKKQEDGSLRIIVDYSTPKYRDASVGRFMYKKLLSSGQYTRLEIAEPSEKHVKYLNSMGFVKDGDLYRLSK